MEYITKDSGQRQDYASGMRRDVAQGKPDFSLLFMESMPYEEQPITRWAALMARGAQKYGKRNFELANSDDELDRFKASAARHFVQWLTNASEEDGEDHMSAVMFNLAAAEYVKWKLSIKDQLNGYKEE